MSNAYLLLFSSILNGESIPPKLSKSEFPRLGEISTENFEVFKKIFKEQLLTLQIREKFIADLENANSSFHPRLRVQVEESNNDIESFNYQLAWNLGSCLIDSACKSYISNETESYILDQEIQFLLIDARLSILEVEKLKPAGIIETQNWETKLRVFRHATFTLLWVYAEIREFLSLHKKWPRINIKELCANYSDKVTQGNAKLFFADLNERNIRRLLKLRYYKPHVTDLVFHTIEKSTYFEGGSATLRENLEFSGRMTQQINSLLNLVYISANSTTSNPSYSDLIDATLLSNMAMAHLDLVEKKIKLIKSMPAQLEVFEGEYRNLKLQFFPLEIEKEEFQDTLPSRVLKLLKTKERLLMSESNKIQARKVSTNKNKSNKTNSPLTTFGFSGDKRKLENLVSDLCAEIELLKDISKIGYLIQVLTADDLRKYSEEVYFNCETKQVAYIFVKLQAYFSNFSLKTAGASQLFFSKKNNPLKYGNLSTSLGSEPKQKKEIDKIFKQMQ